MNRLSFWLAKYQIESPVNGQRKLVHVNGVSPIGFFTLYLSGSSVLFLSSWQLNQGARVLQIAAVIWLLAGLMGVAATHTNIKELVSVIKTVLPKHALLRDGMISSDTCWEIVEQLNLADSVTSKSIWWTRYQNGLFAKQPVEVFVYPLNGKIVIEGTNDIVMVVIDATRLIK